MSLRQKKSKQKDFHSRKPVQKTIKICPTQWYSISQVIFIIINKLYEDEHGMIRKHTLNWANDAA